MQYLKHDVDRYRLKQEAEQLFSTINILNVYMVENLKLEEEYAAKKSSLKYAGRTSKELDEHLVFLGRSKREAMETICQQGVVAEPGLHFLGDPNMGVYLWRHPDLCLDSLTSKMSGTTNYLIILRVSGDIDILKITIDDDDNTMMMTMAMTIAIMIVSAISKTITITVTMHISMITTMMTIMITS